MGLFIQQNESRSKLQERLAAELREKAALQAASTEPMDQTKNSNYLKDTVQTSDRIWLWIITGVIAIVAGVIVYLYIR